jgi:hypothetical protein
MMFVRDVVVERVERAYADRLDARAAALALLEAADVLQDVPLERLLLAVKDEIVWILDQGRTAVLDAWLQSEGSTLRADDPRRAALGAWHQRAAGVLDPGTCVFPRGEVEQLLGAIRESGEGRALARLTEVLERALFRHRGLDERVARMLRVPTLDEIRDLDPVRDSNTIHHFMSHDFRIERELWGYLAEMRPLVAPSANVFFYGTGEFYVRAYRRAFDTHLLFDNWTNWGGDSKRGREAVLRANEIHGRYNIPNAAFLWVLGNLIYVPMHWNRRVGWREFTETEREGWFQEHLRFGEALELKELPPTFREFEEWWNAFDAGCPTASDITRESFEKFLAQHVAARPEPLRPAMTAAMMIGMDPAFRRCLGYAEPSAAEEATVRAAFRTAKGFADTLPPQPWIRSLRSSQLYPHGARVDEIGVQRRGYGMPALARHLDARPASEEPVLANRNDGRPTFVPPITTLAEVQDPDLPFVTMEEVARHDRIDDAWLVVDGFVYDVTRFLVVHPGGQRVLRPHLGKDATAAFARVGHSVAAQVLMTNFRVGRVAS